MTETQPQNPFRFNLGAATPLPDPVVKLLNAPAGKLLGLSELARIYDRHVQAPLSPTAFAELSLRILNIELVVDDSELNRVPSDGPTVVLANHPFGGLEGVILAHLLGRLRNDTRIMANYILSRIAELSPLLIQVDPFGRADSPLRNIAPMRQAMKHVADGGLLAVFPSGEVAHLEWRRWKIADPAWAPSIGRIVRRTGASVVPVYFEGSNSHLFHLAGLVHKRLRTALLPKQLLNKQGSRIRVRFGDPISPGRIARIESDRDLIEYLRLRTYVLGEKPKAATAPSMPKLTIQVARREKPVAPAQKPENVTREIEALPEDSLLVQTDKYQVYCDRAVRMPSVLLEIARLREETFREVGEGTKQPLDMDRFDNYYRHLFVWHPGNQEIAGAYRLGLSDEILGRFGVKGLYTRTLYRFKRDVIEGLGPAVELGRSFVRLKYQREFAPLHLLWKGIGQFLTRHPHYRYLFGPVSISNHYHSVSVRLMADYLKRHNLSAELARRIKPTRPYKGKPSGLWDEEVTGRLLTDLDEISSLIAQIENDGHGVPILLKHYLRLSGQVLGLNIDPRFSDALDALILVDLLRTDRRILSKYFGKAEALKYLGRHGVQA